MIASAVALLLLLAIQDDVAWGVFRVVWLTHGVCYLFLVLGAFVIDRQVASRCWREGVLFPGLVSVVIIGYAAVQAVTGAWGVSGAHPVAWLLSAWLAACMAVAWLAMRLETARGGRWWSRGLLYLAGYGSFLCLVTLAAYVRELRRSDDRWEKTEKRGRALLAS
jgi:hypothetical protein